MKSNFHKHMGYQVAIYAFMGVHVETELLSRYFTAQYADEIIREGYEDNSEEYLSECRGYDRLFFETFGPQFGLVPSSRGDEPLKYYLAIGPVKLIYKYNTSSEERKQLLFDSEIKEPATNDSTAVRQIMSTLGKDDCHIGSWVITQESC
jgi:hypothetical protein